MKERLQASGAEGVRVLPLTIAVSACECVPSVPMSDLFEAAGSGGKKHADLISRGLVSYPLL